jgi:hypothetical protein
MTCTIRLVGGLCAALLAVGCGSSNPQEPQPQPQSQAQAASSDTPRSRSSGSMCQERLVPIEGPAGYRMREGSRCEGRYEGLVALGSLRPVSLVHADQPVPKPAFQLSWPELPEKPEMRIQAVVFRQGLLYRMDARRSVSSYEWPSELLLELDVQPHELGVIVTADNVSVNGGTERVYLPVVLKPSIDTVRGIYLLKIASVEDLSDVFLTVTGPIEPGKPAAAIIKDRPLGRPYYSAAAPIQLGLDLQGRDTGFYRVRVSGTRAVNGGSTSTSFYIRHEQ